MKNLGNEPFGTENSELPSRASSCSRYGIELSAIVSEENRVDLQGGSTSQLLPEDVANVVLSFIPKDNCRLNDVSSALKNPHGIIDVNERTHIFNAAANSFPEQYQSNLKKVKGRLNAEITDACCFSAICCSCALIQVPVCSLTWALLSVASLGVIPEILQCFAMCLCSYSRDEDDDECDITNGEECCSVERAKHLWFFPLEQKYYKSGKGSVCLTPAAVTIEQCGRMQKAIQKKSDLAKVTSHIEIR